MNRLDDSDRNELETRRMKELLTSAHGAIQRLAPPGSPYTANCAEALGDGFSSDGYKLECLMGIVEALRHDYDAGALLPIQDLTHPVRVV